MDQKGIKKEIINYLTSNEKENTSKLTGLHEAILGGNLMKQLHVFIIKDEKLQNKIHIFKKNFKPHKINQNHKEIKRNRGQEINKDKITNRCKIEIKNVDRINVKRFFLKRQNKPFTSLRRKKKSDKTIITVEIKRFTRG